jgi:hypothetical protein
MLECAYHADRAEIEGGLPQSSVSGLARSRLFLAVVFFFRSVGKIEPRLAGWLKDSLHRSSVVECRSEVRFFRHPSDTRSLIQIKRLPGD